MSIGTPGHCSGRSAFDELFVTFSLNPLTISADAFIISLLFSVKRYGITEELKAENQMLWVGKMNMCKAQAEEIVKLELIYD